MYAKWWEVLFLELRLLGVIVAICLLDLWYTNRHQALEKRVQNLEQIEVTSGSGLDNLSDTICCGGDDD